MPRDVQNRFVKLEVKVPIVAYNILCKLGKMHKMGPDMYAAYLVIGGVKQIMASLEQEEIAQKEQSDEGTDRSVGEAGDVGTGAASERVDG